MTIVEWIPYRDTEVMCDEMWCPHYAEWQAVMAVDTERGDVHYHIRLFACTSHALRSAEEASPPRPQMGTE